MNKEVDILSRYAKPTDDIPELTIIYNEGWNDALRTIEPDLKKCINRLLTEIDRLHEENFWLSMNYDSF